MGQTLNTSFDLFARYHHQVGHFVHDDHDIGDRFGCEFLGLEHRIAGFIIKAGLHGPREHLTFGKRLFHTTVVAIDVAHAHFRHLAVALFHLGHDPFERHNGLLGIGDNRRQKMRDTVIDAQFQHLRVDHDHPAFFRRKLVKKAQDHGVDRNRFARPGRPCNQQVRHLGQVGNNCAAANVLAQRQRQFRVPIVVVACRKDFAQEHLFAGLVWKLDPDDRATWNGRHAGRQGRHRARDIIGQTDHTAGLKAGGRLQLVHGDDRAWADRNDVAFHAVVIEHVFKHPSVLFQRLVRKVLARNGDGLFEKGKRRDLVGGVAITEVEHWFGFRAGSLGRCRLALAMLHNGLCFRRATAGRPEHRGRIGNNAVDQFGFGPVLIGVKGVEFRPGCLAWAFYGRFFAR